MSKSERHGIEARRKYGAEEYCDDLVQWINDPEKDEGRARVREILELYRYMKTGWKLVSSGGDGRGRVLANTRKDIHAAGQKLHSLCKQYVYYPAFYPGGGGAEFDANWHPRFRDGFAFADPEAEVEPFVWFPLRNAGKYSAGWPNPHYDDLRAVYDLTQIAQEGFLDRLKKCNCGKWLYARFAHQRFCSSKCREKAFRSDPDEKAKRRKWARKYYWLQKNANVK
jgi:hypothetical protein